MPTLTPGRLSPVRQVPPTIAAAGVRRQAAARTASPGPRSRTPRRSRGCASPAASPRRRWPRSAGTSPRASPPTSSTGSGTSSCCDHGAYPSTLGYRGFPKSLCTSVNEVICHGIPDSTVLRDGDIVNIDITAFIGGVHGDTDATYLVGDVDEESRLLVERTAGGPAAGPSRRCGRAADQRHRPGHRVLRQALRLRRRARLHRSRHRHVVPLRAGRSRTTTTRATTR